MFLSTSSMSILDYNSVRSDSLIVGEFSLTSSTVEMVSILLLLGFNFVYDFDLIN